MTQNGNFAVRRMKYDVYAFVQSPDLNLDNDMFKATVCEI